MNYSNVKPFDWKETRNLLLERLDIATEYTDKRATETKTAELERRGIRLDAGIVDPSDVHAKTPLAEHAVDFIGFMAGKGNVPAYVSASRFRLMAILDGCRFTRTADIHASAIVDFLAGLRDKGKSATLADKYGWKWRWGEVQMR
jgi:hypothetical protein